MNVPAIQIFDSGYGRAKRFFDRSTNGTTGDEICDDLRAAVVFAVAAIDAYFKVKILEYTKSEHKKHGLKFKLSNASEKLIKDQISKELFTSQFKDLKIRRQKEAVISVLGSNKPTLIGYLEDAIINEAFQSVEKIGDAIKIMGETSEKIWNKIDSIVKSSQTKGRSAEVRVQLGGLFKKRNQIVHEADMSLTSLKSGGETRQIKPNEVKMWLKYSEIAVREIDKLIK